MKIDNATISKINKIVDYRNKVNKLIFEIQKKYGLENIEKEFGKRLQGEPSDATDFFDAFSEHQTSLHLLEWLSIFINIKAKKRGMK